MFQVHKLLPRGCECLRVPLQVDKVTLQRRHQTRLLPLLHGRLRLSETSNLYPALAGSELEKAMAKLAKTREKGRYPHVGAQWHRHEEKDLPLSCHLKGPKQTRLMCNPGQALGHHWCKPKWLGLEPGLTCLPRAHQMTRWRNFKRRLLHYPNLDD